MTIFIALIFQVLFVFFAMVTNVGLIVHEKINLQNSVDFAAMYGAQKQAEVLNAIAHTNYQIRQDWKLFVFRIRVMGDLGRAGSNTGANDTHPFYAGFNQGVPYGGGVFTPWFIPPSGSNNSLPEDPPSVCVSHAMWEIPNYQTTNTNLCQNINTGGIGVDVQQPSPPQVFFPPIDFFARDRFQDILGQVSNTCSGGGVWNWAMATTWYATFKNSVAKRLRRIKSLSELLENGLDLDGNPIREGVEKTFRANLTQSNLESSPSISTMNSFNSDSVKGNWLSKIKVSVQVFFTDVYGDSGSCTGGYQSIYNMAAPRDCRWGQATESAACLNGWIGRLGSYLTYDMISNLAVWSEGDLRKAHVGVEKNPWFLAFYGVRASTNPRKPFFPVGNSTTFQAEGFAQPFGGRIGPWYNKTWPRSATDPLVGSGTNNADKTDPLLPPRLSANATNNVFEANMEKLPNFSRFPGDTVGMRSRASLQIPGRIMKQVGMQKLDASTYARLWSFSSEPIEQFSQIPLALNPNMLAMELNAIRPDLFDLYYYTIDPNAVNLFNSRELGDRQNILPDYSRSLNGTDGIRQQIEDSSFTPLNSYLPYKVNNWTHLLTDWVSSGVMEYNSDSGSIANKFGSCYGIVDPDEPPTPGSCVAGGRSGFSVKLVSKSWLQSTGHDLGNDQPGPILNPPESVAQWE
ncbi:MAG: Tad domain-containing protein [Bdellovibrionales bacterium]